MLNPLSRFFSEAHLFLGDSARFLLAIAAALFLGYVVFMVGTLSVFTVRGWLGKGHQPALPMNQSTADPATAEAAERV